MRSRETAAINGQDKTYNKVNHRNKTARKLLLTIRLIRQNINNTILQKFHANPMAAAASYKYNVLIG